jgi:hypothetical protein
VDWLVVLWVALDDVAPPSEISSMHEQMLLKNFISKNGMDVNTSTSISFEI